MADRVSRSLDGRSGDVIVVLEDVSGSRSVTASHAVEEARLVGRFAIVASENMRKAVLEVQRYLPKMIGIYGTFEEAREALQPESNRIKGPANAPSQVARDSSTRKHGKVTRETPETRVTRPNHDPTKTDLEK
jgi:hypothetical protein